MLCRIRRLRRLHPHFPDRVQPIRTRTRGRRSQRLQDRLIRRDASVPDASGLGWVYQYVLQDRSGRMDLAELRALQDFTVRPALQAVTGVAEVASLGGFERQSRS